jgi:hypothetical protein
MSLEHHFSPEIAKIYGVDIAIFLHNIAYWVQKNLANDLHFHEKRYWTYNTLDAFTIIFPYWSRRQIERIINNSLKKGILLKGNFNKTKYDRKGWYALTDMSHKLLNIPISRNGEMEITKRGNGNHQTVTPIADNKPDIKTHKKSFYEKSNKKKHEFADKMQNVKTETKSTVKEIDEDNPIYDIHAKDWHERLDKKRAIIEEMGLNLQPDQISLAKLIKIQANPKLFNKEQSHGRETAEQRRPAFDGGTKGNGLQKAQNYLPH